MPEALIDAKTLTLPQFDEGDAGIILKKDGSFQLWNTHQNIDPNNLTDRQIEQAEILMGFSAALRLPEIMQVLKDVSQNKDIFPETLNLGRPQ